MRAGGGGGPTGGGSSHVGSNRPRHSTTRWALGLLQAPAPLLRRLRRHSQRRQLGRLLLLLSIALTALVALGGRRLLLAGGAAAPATGAAAGATASASLVSILAAPMNHQPQPQQHQPPPPPPAARPEFRPLDNLTPLPAFTAPDQKAGGPTSYVLGATLTRDARLDALLVDVFFMGLSSMRGGATFSGVEQDATASAAWRAAVGTMVADVRRKAEEEGYAYACAFRLAHAWEGVGEGELIPAIVVPVRGYVCRFASVPILPPPDFNTFTHILISLIDHAPHTASTASCSLLHTLLINPQTATTVDGNVNDMTSILRCPLPEGVAEFCRRFRGGELQVRGDGV